MHEVSGISTSRSLAILDNARLRIVLITLAILVALAALGAGLASTAHTHMSGSDASGQTWVERG